MKNNSVEINIHLTENKTHRKKKIYIDNNTKNTFRIIYNFYYYPDLKLF